MENILFHSIFTILFIVANFIFIRAVAFRLNLIFAGRPATGTEDLRKYPQIGRRLKSLVVKVLLQQKLFKEPIRGLMHFFVFYGFLIYTLHTTSQIIAGLAGWGLLDPYTFNLIGELFGPSASHIYEVIVQIVSVLVLIGLAFFAIRRWILKSPGLDVSSPASAVVITMISLLMISTLLGEGARTVASKYAPSGNEFGMIASGIGVFWETIGVNHTSADIVFKMMWWLHILTVFGFMMYVPTSKHSHLIFAPINYLLQTDTPRGAIAKINLEDENAVWGAAKIQDFPWPNLLDGMACIECGRCTNLCPANRTGKVLNPKSIIVEMKHAMLDNMPRVMEARAKNEDVPEDTLVLGDKYISEEAVWGCTSCYACVEACPVGNNHVSTIMELRRHLVLAESRFPKELQLAFTNMENNSNPWGVSAEKRADWAQGLGVKTLAEDPNVDVLYWVGCAGAFDERNVAVAKAFVKILQKAGVNFAILGTEENCTGDSARRGGNEYLYQTLASTNVETMNRYNVKKIVAVCPHCFNTIKNEYPQFGGNYEVVHHSDFIHQLIQDGKLDIKVGEEFKNGKFTYHDSCYLGRYNEVYNGPREIVRAAGGEVLEASDNHTKSLCCGAGGAQMWMEEQGTDRVNNKRTNQLLDTGATTIAVGCPFCMTMIADGVKAAGKTEEVKVKDLSEIIAERI